MKQPILIVAIFAFLSNTTAGATCSERAKQFAEKYGVDKSGALEAAIRVGRETLHREKATKIMSAEQFMVPIIKDIMACSEADLLVFAHRDPNAAPTSPTVMQNIPSITTRWSKSSATF